MTKKNPAAVALGKLGGVKKTSKKQAAARANGRLGGRPKGSPLKLRQAKVSAVVGFELAAAVDVP